MNELNTNNCRCTECPGVACKCGCQTADTNKSCGCGPECNCAGSCACAKGK